MTSVEAVTICPNLYDKKNCSLGECPDVIHVVKAISFPKNKNCWDVLMEVMVTTVCE